MINVILACASVTLAGAAPSASLPAAPTPPVPPAAATAAAAAPALAAVAGQPVPVPNYARACVEAFSKNICDSHLTSTAPQIDGCPLTACRTLYVQEAFWRIPLASNRQNCVPCSGPGQCDETQDLDGTAEAFVQYTLRLNGPCPYRGCFEGRWQHLTEDGTLYAGQITGTLGAGTHRFNGQCCETSADRTCERCLDVEFIPNDDPTTGTWRIGVEGTVEAFAQTGENPQDKLHYSFSGDLYAEGDASGPYINADSFTWKFAGTGDGVHIDYCN